VIRYTLILALSVFSEIGCSRVDREVREWRPLDHDQEIEANSGNPGSLGQQAQVAQAASDPKNAKAKSVGSASSFDDARRTWDALCLGCHGQAGQGDGPRGGRVGAKNLSDPQWQRMTSDSEIAKTITSGRGQMPPFTLSPDATTAMVKLIRSFVSAK
jgi:mono/diheme cytochrome c family protein